MVSSLLGTGTFRLMVIWGTFRQRGTSSVETVPHRHAHRMAHSPLPTPESFDSAPRVRLPVRHGAPRRESGPGATAAAGGNDRPGEGRRVAPLGHQCRAYHRRRTVHRALERAATASPSTPPSPTTSSPRRPSSPARHLTCAPTTDPQQRSTTHHPAEPHRRLHTPYAPRERSIPLRRSRESIGVKLWAGEVRHSERGFG